MKKLLIIALVLLVSGAMQAQEAKVAAVPKSFLAFHAGPSFPVAGFSSTDMNNNPDAGFAKTGFDLNLSYGYSFQKNMGVTGSLFFNQNKINQGGITYKDETSNQEIVLKMNHWQFYGIAAGPMLTFNLGEKVYTDVKLMIGAVNANAPQMSYQGQELTKESWNMAAMYQAGLNVRMDAGKKMFVMAGADYLYLKPTFKYDFSGTIAAQIPSDYFNQKMTMVNVTAGVGFRF